jgi:hypothetical protein
VGNHTINTDVLHSPQAAKYFTGADRRIMSGLRATLEMLQLPLPAYALRAPTGPNAAKTARAAYDADHVSPTRS